MSKSLKEHFKVVDTEITIPLGGVMVDVRVLDVRSVFGRIDYQVTPVKGSGVVWVEVKD
jgi:hypothetical protein